MILIDFMLKIKWLRLYARAYKMAADGRRPFSLHIIKYQFKINLMYFQTFYYTFYFSKYWININKNYLWKWGGVEIYEIDQSERKNLLTHNEFFLEKLEVRYSENKIY